MSLGIEIGGKNTTYHYLLENNERNEVIEIVFLLSVKSETFKQSSEKNEI